MPADYANLQFKAYGDDCYINVFSRCHSVIADAGHALLSDAMYLEKPVLALPAAIYEQQLNANVISENKFGINCQEKLSLDILNRFMLQLDQFRANIKGDKGKVLLPGTNASSLINIIKSITEHMEVSREYRPWIPRSIRPPAFI